MNKRIMLVAGEASGEQHGAELVHALRSQNDTLYFYGTGGRTMRKAGVHIIVDCAELAVMGFGDVIKHLPRIWRVFNQLKKVLQTDPPDLLILIDYPGFNLRLAALAKQLGIKTLFYISPQVWAWRAKRVKKIARLIDHLAVIFPFEVACYQHTDLKVSYVGHPLTHIVKPCLFANVNKQQFCLHEHSPIIGLLPGSRYAEIQRLLPILLKTAEKIHALRPEIQFILPVASTITADLLKPYLAQLRFTVQLVEHQTYAVMNSCDALIIASGTATLEAALLAKPMVIIYKVAPLTALLLKYWLKIKEVGLPNIVAGKRIVPELLQNQANPAAITQAVLSMLEDENYRATMIYELKAMRLKLGNLNGSENVANIALQLLN